jgi:Tol biopolymer transport system component
MRANPVLLALACVGCARLAEPARWTPEALSTSDYESTPTFTPDGRELFFMRSNRQFGGWRLMHSTCGPTGWTSPRPAPFAAPSPALDADPFVTLDGRKVYFASTRHQPDAGDLDLYVVDRLADGGYGTVERLPAPIRSPSAEVLPRVDREGRLTFGSDRPGGLGGSDIYLAQRVPSGAWAVRNLGPPVNTPRDEYEADVSADARWLVLVADRGTRSHLYVFHDEGSGWQETAAVPANPAVFQVGPLLSPTGDRLLFAQADGERSGELFLLSLTAHPTSAWPPVCP